MRYIKILIGILFICHISLLATTKSNHRLQVEVNNITIEEFIKMVSKTIHKNILVPFPINGKVNFISSTPVYKDELLNLLLDILEAKGFTLIEERNYLKVTRLATAVKEGVNIVSKTPGIMKTAIIPIKNINANVVAAKIRQFLSIGGRVIALKDTNTIVVADFPKNIEIIKKITHFIDQNPLHQMKIKFIPLHNTKASRILTQATKMAKAIANQKIPSNKIEIVADNATNSLIIVASQENIIKLEPFIKKLDAKDKDAEQQIAVIPLENAEAKDMVKTINELLAKKSYPKKIDKPTISVDEEMNSLIVSARGQDIKMIKKMVQLLDKERPQVYILAKIVEISENRLNQIGIRYGLEGGKLTSTMLLTGAMNLGGNAIVGSALSPYIDIPSDLKQGVALGAFINFLSNEGAAEILSEPSLLCINNKESSIYVGKTESILVSTVQGNATTDLARNTFKRQDIGLTLKIKPRISSGSKVTIQTKIIQEDVVGGQPGLPTTTKRQVETTTIVNNGESVILGGLIKSKYDDKETKVPLLSDIPLFGSLFKNREKIRDKVNLVVILTPYIIKNRHDMVRLKQKLYRLNSLEERYYDILIQKLKEKGVQRVDHTTNHP